MSISVSTIKTAYNGLHATYTAARAEFEAIGALGEIPEYPIETITDADYNDITEARRTWLGDYASANDAFNTGLSLQKAQEANVVANMPPNQWVKLTSLTGWSPTTQWIGIINSTPTNITKSNRVVGLYTILSSIIEPTQDFPNI